MRSSRHKPSNRRQVYLALVSKVERQLRDAYAKRYEAGLDNQVTLAEKIGVHRSVINRRLTGKQNMTLESVADMVWALGHCIDVDIYDPAEKPTNEPQIVPDHDQWKITQGRMSNLSAGESSTSANLTFSTP